MINYRRLEPAEAPKLVAFVQACYGDSYPYALLYDEQGLRRQIREQTLVSSGAFNEHDELVGHVGIVWEGFDDETPDAITALVREDYQRQQRTHQPQRARPAPGPWPPLPVRCCPEPPRAGWCPV